jgi:type IV secretory pathway VirB4 component
VHGGADGEWFDNEHDATAQSRIKYFDLPQKLNDDVARAYLLCILHRWRKVVTNPRNIGVLKASFIDEAANLFRENSDLAGYAIEAAETFRKYNGFLVLLTQSATSFLTPAFRPLIQNVETQIFFSDPRMSASLAHDLGLTIEERDTIRDLGGRREILFKQGSRSKRLQTCLDSLTLWLCTTDAMQKVKRQEAFEEHGVIKALEVLTNGHDRHCQPATD